MLLYGARRSAAAFSLSPPQPVSSRQRVIIGTHNHLRTVKPPVFARICPPGRMPAGSRHYRQFPEHLGQGRRRILVDAFNRMGLPCFEPLGAFYALFNRVSLFQMKVDKSKCVSCGKCAKACKMDVDVTKTPNHPECIRCGMCIRACPTNAVRFRCGFGTGKQGTVLPEKTNKQMNDIVKEKKS